MKLTLVEKHPETSDVTSFLFKPEQSLVWQAGQYLHYTLPHHNPDDRHEDRFFTNANAPHEQLVRITTRFSHEESSSFKKTLFHLPIGETIQADPPEGDFTFDTENTDTIFIAGGIGITPFRSMLVDLDYKNIYPKITLFYSNRNEEIVFKQLLEELAMKNLNLKIVYIHGPHKIDKEYLAKNISDFMKPIIYLSGPEPMVESLGDILKELGTPENHLKQDFFPGYPIE